MNTKLLPRIVVLVIIILFSEFMIMMLLDSIGVADGFLKDICDVSLLFVIIAPFIYTLVKTQDKLIKARGELEAKVDERTNQLQEANEQLASWTGELEQRYNDFSLLIQLGDLLQKCKTINEAYAIISRSALHIFPADSGSLYLFNNAQTLLESVSSWGGLRLAEDFPPDDCWGLKLGQPNFYDTASTSTACAHIKENSEANICIPVIAQGETMGVLYLSCADDAKLEAKQRLAVSVAEHIGLAIQNLRLSEMLREVSIRDPLTGLFNRRHMDASLEREISRAKRKASGLGIIMLDIDHFKRFNDTLGHEAGDALLKSLGNFLLNSMRSSDVPCRYGGEEFLLILPDASMESALRRAEQMLSEVRELRVEFNGRHLDRITISFGVSAYPDSGLTKEEIISAADAALYQAKRDGRNRVCAAAAN